MYLVSLIGLFLDDTAGKEIFESGAGFSLAIRRMQSSISEL